MAANFWYGRQVPPANDIICREITADIQNKIIW